MIDGKPYKLLKRHLATNGLTPTEYRQRYNLSCNYPMVAPTYVEARRAVATKIGLDARSCSPSSRVPPVAKGPATPIIRTTLWIARKLGQMVKILIRCRRHRLNLLLPYVSAIPPR
jgi:hypothetical protein